MSELPFAITREAEVQIERILLDAQKDLELLAMARVLGYATSSSWGNPEGGGVGIRSRTSSLAGTHLTR